MITRTVRWAILHLQTGRGVKSSENAFAITQEYSVQDLTSAIGGAVLPARRGTPPRRNSVRGIMSISHAAWDADAVPGMHAMYSASVGCSCFTLVSWPAGALTPQSKPP